MEQIYPGMWIHLPLETRLHLVKVFKLERTGVTEIVDQRIVSDGFTVDDLKLITKEKLCEYVGSEETFGRAWELTLAKIHSELNPPVGEIRKVGEDNIVVEPTKESDGVVDPIKVDEELISGPVPTKFNRINKK